MILILIINLLEGFHLIRNDQYTENVAKRPPHGILIYLKEDITVKSNSSFSSPLLEFTKLNIVHLTLNEIKL